MSLRASTNLNDHTALGEPSSPGPKPRASEPTAPTRLRRIRRGPRKVYGAIGGLEVQLASTIGDLRRAQRLRYDVFYEEMLATPSPTAQLRRRDEDAYDAICDHLLVVDAANDRAVGGAPWRRRGPAVIGTYRVLRQDIAERHQGFYSQREYDIAPLLAAKSGLRFLELGRSCVLKPYRTRRAIELLWHGLWSYVRDNGVDVMIGCASFPGRDPSRHAMALSYLHRHALAPAEWRVRAHEHLRVPMDTLPAQEIDMREALKAMPPLIKGYLRLGATFGDGAVVDHQFGTTDVLVILPVDRIDPRYFARFGAPDEVAPRIAAEARGVM
jgi:putative hemolysin